jgi:hypothetical protein
LRLADAQKMHKLVVLQNTQNKRCLACALTLSMCKQYLEEGMVGCGMVCSMAGGVQMKTGMCSICKVAASGCSACLACWRRAHRRRRRRRQASHHHHTCAGRRHSVARCTSHAHNWNRIRVVFCAGLGVRCTTCHDFWKACRRKGTETVPQTMHFGWSFRHPRRRLTAKERIFRT